MKNVFFFFFYNTRQSKEIEFQGKRKWNFLMEYIFQEERERI